MLKSPVFVALCNFLLINYLPANAHSRKLVAPAGAGMSGLVSYTMPGRPMRKFADAYIKENDEELAEIRQRSSQPFMIIDSVMDHYDLPEELRYLAVIESELQPMAVSRVGAKGPWQLMAGTARELGLKVGRRSDERTNYYKSTWAAALYLRDLHREFGDWLLVLAAYNAGPAPVYRAMRLAGSRNFWVLERYLPGETRQHIRRFIATDYYFTSSGPVVDPVHVGPAVDPVHVGPAVDPLHIGAPVDPLYAGPGPVGEQNGLAGHSAGLHFAPEELGLRGTAATGVFLPGLAFPRFVFPGLGSVVFGFSRGLGGKAVGAGDARVGFAGLTDAGMRREEALSDKYFIYKLKS